MILMQITAAKLKQVFSKTVSTTMVLWLSSVLIFVCCGTMPENISASEMTSECHQMQHEATPESEAKRVSESGKDKMDCCVFKPHKTLSADLQSSKDLKNIRVAEKASIVDKPVYLVKQNYQPVKVYRSAIHNRGSTYLQNCNFRI